MWLMDACMHACRRSRRTTYSYTSSEMGILAGTAWEALCSRSQICPLLQITYLSHPAPFSRHASLQTALSYQYHIQANLAVHRIQKSIDRVPSESRIHVSKNH